MVRTRGGHLPSPGRTKIKDGPIHHRSRPAPENQADADVAKIPTPSPAEHAAGSPPVATGTTGEPSLRRSDRSNKWQPAQTPSSRRKMAVPTPKRSPSARAPAAEGDDYFPGMRRSSLSDNPDVAPQKYKSLNRLSNTDTRVRARKYASNDRRHLQTKAQRQDLAAPRSSSPEAVPEAVPEAPPRSQTSIEESISTVSEALDVEGSPARAERLPAGPEKMVPRRAEELRSTEQSRRLEEPRRAEESGRDASDPSRLAARSKAAGTTPAGTSSHGKSRPSRDPRPDKPGRVRAPVTARDHSSARTAPSADLSLASHAPGLAHDQPRAPLTRDPEMSLFPPIAGARQYSNSPFAPPPGARAGAVHSLPANLLPPQRPALGSYGRSGLGSRVATPPAAPSLGVPPPMVHPPILGIPTDNTTNQFDSLSGPQSQNQYPPGGNFYPQQPSPYGGPSPPQPVAPSFGYGVHESPQESPWLRVWNGPPGRHQSQTINRGTPTRAASMSLGSPTGAGPPPRLYPVPEAMQMRQPTQPYNGSAFTPVYLEQLRAQASASIMPTASSIGIDSPTFARNQMLTAATNPSAHSSRRSGASGAPEAPSHGVRPSEAPSHRGQPPRDSQGAPDAAATAGPSQPNPNLRESPPSRDMSLEWLHEEIITAAAQKERCREEIQRLFPESTVTQMMTGPLPALDPRLQNLKRLRYQHKAVAARILSHREQLRKADLTDYETRPAHRDRPYHPAIALVWSQTQNDPIRRLMIFRAYELANQDRGNERPDTSRLDVLCQIKVLMAFLAAGLDNFGRSEPSPFSDDDLILFHKLHHAISSSQTIVLTATQKEFYSSWLRARTPAGPDPTPPQPPPPRSPPSAVVLGDAPGKASSRKPRSSAARAAPPRLTGQVRQRQPSKKAIDTVAHGIEEIFGQERDPVKRRRRSSGTREPIGRSKGGLRNMRDSDDESYEPSKSSSDPMLGAGARAAKAAPSRESGESREGGTPRQRSGSLRRKTSLPFRSPIGL